MTVSSILVVFCVFLSGVSATAVPKEARKHHGPLPRAFGSPLNVDPNVDCTIKNLAWEYAKKLIPRVSSHFNIPKINGINYL